MGQHVLSIIVPVYNSDEYLERCIRSILCQTFTDFELLLIDDGSIDNSNQICNEYARNDVRIRVFHKQNGGVSSARNMGLDNAKGEWITFVDSDDWLSPDYLMNLYACVNENVDLIIAYSATVLLSGDIIMKEHGTGWVYDDNFSDLFSKYEMYNNTTCWAKLYKTSCIKNNKIRFNESMSMGEDTAFLYNYLAKSSVIYVSGHVDYFYRDVPRSLSKKIFSLPLEVEGYKQINNVITQLLSDKRIDDIIAEHNLKSLKAYYVWRVLQCLYNSGILIPVEKRLKVIRMLDCSVVDYIECGDTIKWKILKWLLRHRLYLIYDNIKFVSVRLKAICRKFIF